MYLNQSEWLNSRLSAFIQGLLIFRGSNKYGSFLILGLKSFAVGDWSVEPIHVNIIKSCVPYALLGHNCRRLQLLLVGSLFALSFVCNNWKSGGSGDFFPFTKYLVPLSVWIGPCHIYLHCPVLSDQFSIFGWIRAECTAVTSIATTSDPLPLVVTHAHAITLCGENPSTFWNTQTSLSATNNHSTFKIT